MVFADEGIRLRTGIIPSYRSRTTKVIKPVKSVVPRVTAVTIVLVILATYPLIPVSRGDTLVVANKAEATASLIDVGSGNVVATLPTGEGPHEVGISPDGRFALISGTVAVAVLNIVMFAGVDGLSEAETARVYAQIYLIGLVIPGFSVSGVVLASLQKRATERRNHYPFR